MTALVLIGGLAATLAAHLALQSIEEERLRARFERQAIAFGAVLHGHIWSDLLVVDGLVTLYEGSEEVTDEEFARATARLSRRVSQALALAFLRAQGDGFAAQAQAAVGRAPVLTAELLADPLVLAAARRAAETRSASSVNGLATASGTDGSTTLLFAPASRTDAQGPMLGLVALALAPQACLDVALEGLNDLPIDVRLFAREGGREMEIARSMVGGPEVEQLAWSRDLQLGALAWRLECRMPMSDLSALTSQAPWLALALGAVISIALAAYTAFRSSYVERIEDTVRRQTRELAEWKERYEAAAQASRLMLYDYDARSNRLLLGGEVDSVLGVAPGILPGGLQAFEASVHPDDLPRVRDERQRLIEGADHFAREYRVKAKGGEWIHVRDEGRIVRAADGTYVRTVGFASDVTALKRAEELLRRSHGALESLVRDRTAELEASNRELESFSYSVSHDLRSPLRAIQGFARMLLEDHGAGLESEAQRKAAVIVENAEHMARLIDDLLAFSRKSRQPLSKSDVELDELVAEVWSALPAERRERVESHFQPLGTVRGDRALLHQVFSNLLDNALKFSRTVEQPRIDVGREETGGEPVFFVRDNGAGFDPKLSAKLFGVFQRLHRAEQFEGTGVGLALVRRIVERHGGRIWAESEPGRGATFRFTLGAGGHAPA